ncbi:sulfite reductase [Polynucleobacter sp. SHI8]|uniref:nitrite/sulfite reductase n=1 Tax=unclassified Polynucleobacter TaxID=2640945 RepID=UPI00249241FB|nr:MULTISPECIES: nitrite/sulfite reductase [unclassified Polynucleobacter]BDW10467.1 sulfite reductase [Polynucleobacter sp. SHI2]BDW12913.1 sulfite reductase [Polynucleobacter sp. SHI8]
MYQYDEIDQALVDARVDEFRNQVERRLDGSLPEEEFRPLRLQNGLYLQRHAYMLRVAIPYGILSSRQLEQLAMIANRYDRGYGHFTTRQNIQFNWLKLEESPEILAYLAKVQMHAIQTSGNVVRNITSDPFAGVAHDEQVDPRPICELLRQWSTLHPEFAFLPRKFKIAINGATYDRAVIMAHDVGLLLKKDEHQKMTVDIYAGGGMGRTPLLASLVKSDLPWQQLPSYLNALLRVYNRYGRRDNLYKARIKILVKALGATQFSKEVEDQWIVSRDRSADFTDSELARVAKSFTKPAYKSLSNQTRENMIHQSSATAQKAFSKWLERNTKEHQVSGYISVVVSLKNHQGSAPGDATSEQMMAVAKLAQEFSFSEIRVTHEQNLVLADVEQSRLFALYQELTQHSLARSNIGLLTDMIVCPGGDFCSLANAKSLPIAAAIAEQYDNLDYLYDLGNLSINISGCINSCGHHHVANIGILGVDKDGTEWYQITLGGDQGNDTAIGKVIGPSFSAEQIPSVIAQIIEVFEQHRLAQEAFIETYQRIGMEPFKEFVYQKAERDVEHV